MNKQQFKFFTEEPVRPSVIGITDLTNREMRTLIFGHTSNGNRFHVYLGPDGFIHVMRYAELARAKPGPHFLVLHHTSGETGGVPDNGSYLPDDPVFPESCDFEFCNLLRKRGVLILFTSYSEEALNARSIQWSRFSGAIEGHPTGQAAGRAVSLNEKIITDALYPKVSNGCRIPLARLVRQAASELNVPMTGDEYVVVASSGAENVLERVREFFRAGLVLDRNLALVLAAQLFGGDVHVEVLNEQTKDGEFTFSVMGAVDTRPYENGRKRYVAKADGDWQAAVVGCYEGRLYFACTNRTGMTNVHFSQFGDEESFLTQWLDSYQMVPAPVA